jgi:type III restriction enzyme
MPPRGRPPRQIELPPDWQPTQAVDEPIINTPYDEPSSHWIYKNGTPFKMPGRRPASYWYTSKKVGSTQAGLFAEEQRDDLPLVNRLREDVKRWQESGYRGASSVTRDLLAYWNNRDRPRPFFFCQREAVETAIYLLEIAFPDRLGSTGFKSFKVRSEALEKLLIGEKPPFEEIDSCRDPEFFPRLIDPTSNPDYPLNLRRMGCKMATGSGKTVIMAMLVAWAFCNRGRNPATTTFPNGILVCAPNLTVKERLQVLNPEHRNNYYDAFDIVPSKYRELMNSGRVLVTNWHTFSPKSEHEEGGKSYKVVNKGEETPEAFAKDRLGELASRMPILVLNDEGHHCWRPKPGVSFDEVTKKRKRSAEEDLSKEEIEEARVWLAGLDRINNSGLAESGKPGILACIDLSATPFYLQNSGYPAGSPFPWLISDFGLVDAIESGIVKIPRLPVRDDTESKDDVGRPDPKYFRLWRNINDKLKDKDRLSNGRPKPDAVYREAEGALLTLASQWKKRFEEIRDGIVGKESIPPVMIVVCDNTEISEVVFQRISGEREVEVLSEDGKRTVKKTIYEPSTALFPELANEEGVKRTIRIDTKLLAKVETEEGETKDEAAQALRIVIASVGKKGEPGEQVRCVVSVSMLTEGWDANNVTHVLGIRAFDSQLLCEQVVGRGLRRMDYHPDPETGMLVAEHVDVYGIPFSLIPFKGKAKEGDKKDPVYHHVHAVPERGDFEIRMPVVESYTYDLRGSGISCDVDKLTGFIVNHEPTTVYLSMARGYQDTPHAVPAVDFIKQDRKSFYESVRPQQIVFRIAQLLMDDLLQGVGKGENVERIKKASLARHQIFPELVRIIQQYIERKVQFADGVDPRELALEKYVKLLRERIRDGIHATSYSSTLLPIVNSYKPWISTGEVDYRTARPVIPLTLSHLNFAVRHSDWEQQVVEILEDMDSVVECFTPNDRNIGLVVPYEYMEAHHRYEPDFIVRMRGGKLVMLEIKGKAGELHEPDRVKAKEAAACKWVTAVNNAGRYGEWTYVICRDLKDLRSTLSQHASGEIILPFRKVDPGPKDRYVTCVPLTTLRAAAGRWSEEQAELELGEDTEWIAFETSTRFDKGMFVAKVHGDSMEPLIPNGAYCLFRKPPAGSRQGKRLLVLHSGIADAHTGGQYTVKVYSSEKSQDGEEGWKHTRIVLKSLNTEYEPIVLTPSDEGDVQVIAEFVEVVGGTRGEVIV